MSLRCSLDYDSNYIARRQTVCLVFVNESGALEQVIRVWPRINRWREGERSPECPRELRRDRELWGKSAPRRKGIAGQQLIIYSFTQIVPNTRPHTFLGQKSQTLQPSTQVPLCPSSVTSTCSTSAITNPSATRLKPPFTPSAPP